jgi:hypothetical protein
MHNVVFNNTNKPLVTKRWWINQDTIGEDDLKWLRRFGAQVNVDQPTHTFEVMGGGTHKIAGKLKIEVTTTTDEQQNMLMLKYSERLVLIEQFVTLPNSMTVTDGLI